MPIERAHNSLNNKHRINKNNSTLFVELISV